MTLLLHRDLRALCVAAWMLLMNDDQVISGTIREWRRCLQDSLQDARHCMYTACTKARSTQDREREAEHSWHTEEESLLLSTAAWTPKETSGAQEVHQPAPESVRVKARAPRDPAA